MPYKSGLIQAALGAFGALAFIISQSFGAPDRKEKIAVGVLQKTGDRTFALKENATRSKFELSPAAKIFINAREVGFTDALTNRRATVRYQKLKRQLIAKVVDIFPTPEDLLDAEAVT